MSMSKKGDKTKKSFNIGGVHISDEEDDFF